MLKCNCGGHMTGVHRPTCPVGDVWVLCDACGCNYLWEDITPLIWEGVPWQLCEDCEWEHGRFERMIL